MTGLSVPTPEFEYDPSDNWYDWVISSKEQLTPEELLSGLLEYGLFAEKVPPCFTSKGLATTQVVNGLREDWESEKNLGKWSHDYIRYDSLRDINIPRHLGIPHPEAYSLQSLVIQKYWKEIVTHSNQPFPRVSRIYVRHSGDGCIFDMNYKGEERFPNEEEEICWRMSAKYVVKADIASCFPSIYTHAIPWALHTKSEAKAKTSDLKLYGNLLDKCTQNLRDKQTNGLLIGPVTSNIISEIILTSIDVELQAKKHIKLVRHIDDYTFYAENFEEAEIFLKDLRVALRGFEMSMNDKKTRISVLPKPTEENWILALMRFVFPGQGEISFSIIRSFLDLALECAQAADKSSPLNYAFKVIAGKDKDDPRQLNIRAKRLYAQEAMNLAYAYPYLVPLLDEMVFERYWHDGLKKKIADFSALLLKLGLSKLYPDTIAHAIFFALKYEFQINVEDNTLLEVVGLDDCLTNVLLLKYAIKQNKSEVEQKLICRANKIKLADKREADKNWLLIYQLWSEEDLDKNGQKFLAKLKAEDFKFVVVNKTTM